MVDSLKHTQSDGNKGKLETEYVRKAQGEKNIFSFLLEQLLRSNCMWEKA